MKPTLPLLRYPTKPISVTEPPPLDHRSLQSGLAHGAAASGLFLLTQILVVGLITGIELHGKGLFLIPRFLEQVLGRGFWELPWFFLQAAVLGMQLWSLLELRRVLRWYPDFPLANRATFFWLALICLLGLAGLFRLGGASGLAVLAALLAAVSGYGAIICQTLVYRALARRTATAAVTNLSFGLLIGLSVVPVIGIVTFGSVFTAAVSNVFRSIGGGGKPAGKTNPQAHHDVEILHLILVVAVLATVLLHLLMTLAYYLEMRNQKKALPMAIEVLPNKQD